MHAHEHDLREADPLRPKGSRVDDSPDATLLQAAAAGRRDVLGAAGMLQLQRAIGNAGTAALAEDEQRSPVLDVVGTGGGRALDAPVRAEMEARLGADFSDVRVHSDSTAHQSAKAVGAHAYTVGSDVVFQSGKYDPSSHSGKTMLAHELTHVIQQRSGPVDGTATGDGVRVSDPSDRFERAAAENAERVMAGGAPASHADHAGHDHAVQREAVPDEEEEVQMLRDPSGPAVQREAVPDEEDEVQMLRDPSVQREEESESESEEV